MRGWIEELGRNGRYGGWIGLMCVSGGLLYLTNPGAGLFELIPDGAPLVGNLDEAVATLVLVLGLRLAFARPCPA